MNGIAVTHACVWGSVLCCGLSPACAGAADAATVARLSDGRGEYSLAGFISHMGANTACGHYVAHVRKEGRWVIYNDEKVIMQRVLPYS